MSLELPIAIPAGLILAIMLAILFGLAALAVWLYIHSLPRVMDWQFARWKLRQKRP